MAKRKKRAASLPKKTNSNFTISTSSSLVDIIIPVYQRFDLLGKCIQAIPDAANGVGYKIIIVDNGSPREEADEFYKQFGSDIKIIRNKENLGFPKACNLGFHRSLSPLVFFLNDDVILQPNSLALLVNEMDDHKVGVVGMKLLFPDETDLPHDENTRPSGKVQHVGLATNIRAEVIHQFLGWSSDHPKVNAMRKVFAVTGAALLTRRQLYIKVGGFPEIYGLGTWEDVDYCMSIGKLGYNIVVNTQAIGIHHTGATAEKYKIGYPLQQNRMIFMQRWANSLGWSEIDNW